MIKLKYFLREMQHIFDTHNWQYIKDIKDVDSMNVLKIYKCTFCNTTILFDGGSAWYEPFDHNNYRVVDTPCKNFMILNVLS